MPRIVSMRVGLAVVAALGFALASPAALAQAKLKLGFIAVLSGPLAILGAEQRRGLDIALEQLGGKIGDMPVEIIQGDSKANPGATTQELSRLIEKERVDILTGLTLSSEILAGIKPITDAKIFFLGTNGGPAATAGEQCSPYYFNVSFQNEQITEGIGAHMNAKGVKKLYLLAMDYEAGHEHSNAAKKGFKGEIVAHVFTPPPQVDFAADIAKVRASGADALWAFYPGGPGIAFMRQWSQAGLADKIPLYSNLGLSEPLVFQAQGKTAIGTSITAHYMHSIDNPENKRFVEAFRKKYNRDPAGYAANQYDAVMLLDSALKAVKGNLKDQDALRAALKKADFKSVRGPFRFNNNHHPIMNSYLGVVDARQDGSLQLRMTNVIAENLQDNYATKCPMK